MYRERISISETACWLLFVFLVTKVASFVAEDAKDSGWCEDPDGTCSRCLESNAVKCSGIANARLRGDLCGCCASCAVDRELGESCGSQLSVRPLNNVDSWTAVLATSWCHKGLVCIDFVCRNSTVNKEPTVLTTRASIAGVQQMLSIEDIGLSDDSSFVGEDDRANFLLGENVSPAFYRQANHDKLHTTERARSYEEARSNARPWRKLKTGFRKSQQETLTNVEASAYTAVTNFIADQIDTLTSLVATRIMQEDDKMIGVAFARNKFKAITKTLKSVLPPLEDGTTQTMPKSDVVVNIRQGKPCAATERSGNSTTITIGDREFRIIHGTDLMSDLKVLLDAIDHSDLDFPRGDWTLHNSVSLLIDSVRDRPIKSSTDNELVGNPTLSTSWKDRSSHTFRQIFKAVEEVPCDPTRQEFSTAIVSSATTKAGQEFSTKSTVTNVTSAMAEDGQASSTSSIVKNVTSATTKDGQESSTSSTVTNVTSATTKDGQESSTSSTLTNVTSTMTVVGQASSTSSIVKNVTSATTKDGQESSTSSTVTNVTSTMPEDGQESSTNSTVTNVTYATTEDGQASPTSSIVTNVASTMTEDEQESSTNFIVTNVTFATTEDGQESCTGSAVTNVGSPVLGGVLTTRVSPATLQTKIMPATGFGTASTRLLTRIVRTADPTPTTRIPSSTARYKNTEEPETSRSSQSPNFAPVDSSLAKRRKRSRRGLVEIDEDDYETNESVLRFDSLKSVQQLLSHDIEDRKSYEDSASPGISTRIDSSNQGVSSLYDEVYGEYPEELVMFFDNDDSKNRSTHSVDIGRSLTKVTDRGRGSGVTKRMPALAESQNVSGDLKAFRAIGNSPTFDDGRSSNGIPANRIPMRATSSPKIGEARRVNATSLAIDDLFNRIETRMDGLERRIEGSVLKRCEPLRSQGLQDSRGVQNGRSRLQSEEVESRHEVPINESTIEMLRRAENVTVNGGARERNRTEIRRFGNRRRMGNHGNDRAKTILRSELPDDAVPDEGFVADGHERKRGPLLQDSAEATLRNSTVQGHWRPMYARRRLSTRWRRPMEQRRRFHEEISAEGVDRLEYPEKNGRQDRDRESRRVARHSIWSPKALRSLPPAMNDDGSKTSRFCGHTQEIPGQGSSDDYPQAPTSLEVLRLESPSPLDAEAFDSKRLVPWKLFASRTDGPNDPAKFGQEPAESRGQSSQWPYYAVTNRGNSSISIDEAISGAQYEDIAAIHDDDDDFDHLYGSVEANDDEDWTMMASVDSHDRTDYFDGTGSHMAPVLLEIYGSQDNPESDESGIRPEFPSIASMNGRTSRSTSEDTVSFPNLHSPSAGKRSFSSPTPLVPPQRQKTRDPISRIWNSLSTDELATPNAAASHQRRTSSPMLSTSRISMSERTPKLTSPYE